MHICFVIGRTGIGASMAAFGVGASILQHLTKKLKHC